MLPGEGRLPVIAEPIRATIRLKVPGPAEAYPLDSSGRRMTPLPAECQDGWLVICLERGRSIWFEVVSK
jgi:hypothetical protein